MLSRLFNHGALKGAGRLFIYPVDQGLEHGPLQSFSKNPAAFDPHYHVQFAVDSGASAYACPLGAMHGIALKFSKKIPLILKLNGSNRLYKGQPDQAVMASVEDALSLGCAGIGLTIYPGSDLSLKMIEQGRDMVFKAHKEGLFVVIWAYIRGPHLTKEDETSLDNICHGVHIAAQLNADLIKVKLPSAHISDASLRHIKDLPLKDRIDFVVKSALGRPVVFSGGEAKDIDSVLQEIQAIRDGGGCGTIMGRNLFQRPYTEALDLAQKAIEILRS